jgi:penicillin-binding protein 1C
MRDKKAPASFRILAILSFCLLVIAPLLPAWMTFRDIRPLPERLISERYPVRKPQLLLLDRNGLPLSVTYQNRWNLHDQAALYQVPVLLQQSFIEAEDHRFYEHKGVDWLARLHAIVQNVSAMKAVRGASTISEQVVRMLHPRPRTLRSRLIEGFEAARMETCFSKAEILEFYLNQVPYAEQRRGVLQAARLYFDRDLDTLSIREMLALAVLVRAPSTMDLRREGHAMDARIEQLASRLLDKGIIDENQYRNATAKGEWSLAEARLEVEAAHFAYHIHKNWLGNTEEDRGHATNTPSRIHTTLDSSLQQKVQRILDSRLVDLHTSKVTDGAVLVVDHETDEVLAWVNGGAVSTDLPGSWIDAVTAPRQPGSTLKPFLYALALEMGRTPATLIDDSPLSRAIGPGLHSFHNYSRTHYGLLRLRDALGNSLNIPALRTIQFTGVDRFLERLHDLGFHSLSQPPDHYGEGLALGNGEVTLFELVQAYASLARQGNFRPLKLIRDEALLSGSAANRRVYREEDATLIADILSDPQARRLEFGDGHLLRLPVQTAVKTGTSNDHRDAWAMGFSDRYTVGVWMGNLDRRPTSGVTGAAGPGLVLRAVFAELNRYREPRPLYRSSLLRGVNICRITGLRADSHCPSLQEWFSPDRVPQKSCSLHLKPAAKGSSPTPTLSQSTNDQEGTSEKLRLLQPTPGLQLARDPRIPDELEAFTLTLPKHVKTTKVEWIVDGMVAGVTGVDQHSFLWPLMGGPHSVKARVWRLDALEPIETESVVFLVK